jgi:hypothetical protein
MRDKHAMEARPDANLDQNFTFDSNHFDSHNADLNMSRVGYQFPSIPGIAKKLPAVLANLGGIFGSTKPEAQLCGILASILP